MYVGLTMPKLVVGLLLLSALLPFYSASAISCKSFATQAQAQAYYNARKPDWAKLDRDKDGGACDCNGKGSKYCEKKGKKKKSGKNKRR